MKETLLLLVMASLCSLSVGHKHVYHFINESKTWIDAVNFCREHYSDMATVDEQKNAGCVCPRDDGCKDAWVRGNFIQQSKGWHWIDQSEQYDLNKANWKPNTHQNEGNCACVQGTVDNQQSNDELLWYNQSCGVKNRVICYNEDTGKADSDKFIAENEMMTWCEALFTCKRKKMALVCGDDQVNNDKFKKAMKDKGSDLFFWIGLINVKSADELCSCFKLGENNSLVNDSCTNVHPFICYDDHMVLVKKNKTFEEALVYCRRNYGDLAMMTDEHQQRMVQRKATMAETEFVWVGLHFACFFKEWMWVNGHWVSYYNEMWENTKEPHGCDVAGAMKKTGEDKWVKRNIGDQYNFVCSIH